MKTSKVLKHIFVPHEHNNYGPHFFREISVSIIALVAVFLFGLSLGSSFFLERTVLGVNISTSVLVDLTNESRLAVNQPVLTRNPTLDTAASLKAAHMIENNYFSHDSPEGVTPWHWFNVVGYKFLYAGENLAVNFTESSDVQKAWLNSRFHRENLLNTNFREIGMSAVEGIYKEAPTIFIVQLFGTPDTRKVEAPKVEVTQQVENIPVDTSAAPSVSPQQPSETFAIDIKEGEGEVKGESDRIIVPVVTTTNLAIVKTVTVEKVATTSSGTTTEPAEFTTTSATDVLPEKEVTRAIPHSTWYERAVFFASPYIGYIYKAMLLVVFLAFSVLLLVEFRRQHYKHALYGVFLLVLLSLLLTINTLFFT